MQTLTNRDNVDCLERIQSTPPQQQQPAVILSQNCDITQLLATQAEVAQLRAERKRLAVNAQRWQQRAEHATARADRQSLFLELIDAVCLVPTKFLDGSEKIIFRCIARAVMFDSRAQHSGDFTLVDLPRLIRDVGGFSRTLGDVARLVDMGLFLQQPSPDGALWLAIPDDILDRLAHLDSAFARRYGSPLRCPACGHNGPPTIRRVARQDVVCSGCGHAFSTTFQSETFSLGTGERSSEPLTQDEFLGRVNEPLPDQPQIVDAEPVSEPPAEPVPELPAPAAPAPASQAAPEPVPAEEPEPVSVATEPEPPAIIYYDRPITRDGLDVLLSMGRVTAFPLSPCPHCLGHAFNWTGRVWGCARCSHG